MAPFLESEGGPLTSDEIDALVAFIRAWEDDPPVEFPPEIEKGPVAGGSRQVFSTFCAQCHGEDGAGGADLVGPSLTSDTFQNAYSDEELFTSIDRGHSATSMIAWGDVLTAGQVEGLVEHIRSLVSRTIVYSRDIEPIFQASCSACHGSLGGWDSSSLQLVIESGDSGPAVIPGDPEGSNLVRSLRGTGMQTMPPAGELSDAQIDLIVEWITGGATEEVTIGGEQAGGSAYTWTVDVQPILATSCGACHGSSGGWDAATYDSTINSGNGGPAVSPGNADGSSLAQRLLGNGALMPPSSALSDDQIQIIIDWINNGAAR